MFKKLIKYEDFDGNQREEIFYFNLTKAEISEAQLSVDGGLSTKLERIVASQSTSELIKVFKEFILLSYGEKSDDGKHFRKSKEITDEFTSTNAYSELFMELSTNTDFAIEFIKGIMPSDFADKINEELKKLGE